MKKIFTLSLFVLLCCCFQLRAQQYVSTEPTNRNVILEEFTGRDCGYCPAGHAVANNIAAANPGRFWAVNIHSPGSLSPTSYPNLNTTVGQTIQGGFSISGLPNGSINRRQGAAGNGAVGRGEWASLTNAQLQQASVANIGGICVIDPATRMATIKIEVYYTANGVGTSNKLTVAMLQSNIVGNHSGASTNPPQHLGGSSYNNMHTLRHIITSTWGDAISPVTAGTLIEKTYEYQIPETIGSPNGVEVVLEDLEFLVWVAEANYFIITANELEVVFGSDKPINPAIKSVAQRTGIYCTDTKIVDAKILNGGVDEITSIEFEYDVDGVVTTYVWEGSIASYANGFLNLEVEAPNAEQTLTLTILKVNGVDVEQNSATTMNTTLTSDEWSALPDPLNSLTLRLWQDRFGNQITWKVFSSDMSIIASGGPYTILPSGGTKLHEHVIPIANDDCIKFAVYDVGGNGFNNTQGEGHYELEDSNGNIVFESDATFESEESICFNVTLDVQGIKDNNSNKVNIYPNPANDYINISGVENAKSISIYNVTGKVVYQSNAVKNHINISELSQGVYIINLVNSDDSQVNVKFIKK